MRAFIAIELMPEIKEYLSKTQNEVKKHCRRGNFTPEENFHLTLHFLGEIEEADLEYLREAMFEAAARNRTFDLKLGKIGFFGRGEKGVLWNGLEKSDSLQRLFFSLEKSLERQGFAREKKGMSPHITLGRDVEPQRSFQDVQKAVWTEGKTFRVEQISLMESVRKGPRLVYVPRFQQPLQERKEKLEKK